MGKVIYIENFNNCTKHKEGIIDMDNFAKKILEKYDLLELPVDPFKLARIENIDIYNASFKKMDGDYVLGAIQKDENEDISIYINERDPYTRKRFTLAHELGHYYLGHLNGHENQIVELERNAGYNTYNTLEIQANQFAASLLMEKNSVIEYYNILKKSNHAFSYILTTLSNIFGVSQQAMNFRLKNLGLINE